MAEVTGRSESMGIFIGRNTKAAVAVLLLAMAGAASCAGATRIQVSANDGFEALQAALDRGRFATAANPLEVEVGAGTIRITDALGIFSNTTLSLNPRTTICRVDGSKAKVMLAGRHLAPDGQTSCTNCLQHNHGFGYTQLENVTVRGGVWDGGSNTRSVTGAFALTHGCNITIRDLTVSHFTEHIINLSASRDITVERVTFTDALQYSGQDVEFWTNAYAVGDTNRYFSIEALHLDVANAEGEPSTYPLDDTPCRNVTVRDCCFVNVFAGLGNHHAIMASNGTTTMLPVLEDGLTVEGCGFTNLASYALHVHGFTNCTFIGNSAKDCAGMMWLNRSGSVTASGNTVVSPGRLRGRGASAAYSPGFSIERGTDLLFEGNFITAGKRSAFIVTGGEATLANNVIDGMAECGISVLDDARVEAVGNVVAKTADTGIYIKDCTGGSYRENTVRGGLMGFNAVLSSDI